MKSNKYIKKLKEFIDKSKEYVNKIFYFFSSEQNTRNSHIVLLYSNFILLSFSYIFIIAPKFGYMFTDFNTDFSLLKLLFSIFILSLLIKYSIDIKDEFLYCVALILIAYYFSAEAVIWIFNNDQLFGPLFSTIILIGLIIIFQNVNIKLPNIKLNEEKSIKIIVLISILMFLPFVFYYFKYINLKNLFFIDVYETRLLFREIDVPGILGYIKAPLSRILLPYLIIFNFKKKKKNNVILFSCMIIYIYLCGALKSIFLGLVLAIFFYKGSYKDKVTYFLLCLVFGTLVGIILYYTFGNLTILNTLIRRIFFVEPRLENVYFNYFNDNFTYLSQTGFGLIDYPYDLPIPLYVGSQVMGYEGLSANVGVLTDGFISFGYLGVIAFSLFIVFFIIYVKSIKIDPIYFGIFFVYIYYLNTSLLSVLLLTHGMLFFCFFCFLIKKETN